MEFVFAHLPSFNCAYGFKNIGNTDGFIQFTNKSAVVGDNQMELLMDSGGATTIQNVMKFQIPVAEDSGTLSPRESSGLSDFEPCEQPEEQFERGHGAFGITC